MWGERRDAGGARGHAAGRTSCGAVLCAASLVLIASCGTTEKASRETLPPIATTTSTTTTPTTSLPPGATQLYKVQSGDTLSGIAQAFNVTTDALMDANGMTDPNQLNAGVTLNIPLVILVEELPTTTVAEG